MLPQQNPLCCADDPRSHEYRPRIRFEAGPAAPKPMAPGNDATFLWRHAVDRRFGAAVDNTRRCRHHIPASLLRPLTFPRFALFRATPMVPLGCGHRRAAERSGLYQTQPLNLALGAPRRAINPYGFGSARGGLGVGVSPRAHVSVRERTRPSTFPLIVVDRSHPSLRPMRPLASERRSFSDRAVDLYGRLCRQGPWS